MELSFSPSYRPSPFAMNDHLYNLLYSLDQCGRLEGGRLATKKSPSKSHLEGCVLEHPAYTSTRYRQYKGSAYMARCWLDAGCWLLAAAVV